MSVRKLAPLVLLVAALCAYHNSFAGAFVFDDLLRIPSNLRIRRLWPPWETMAGTSRPLVQLTLALNYAVGGLEPWSYHVFNLGVHVLVALVLFGVLHRTLGRSVWPAAIREAAAPLALASAVLWTVHPLTTQAVTYVIQRSEALTSLFYLLVLYCVIRGIDGPPVPWYAAAVACTALGAAAKPVIASAPVLVLLWDRCFAAGSIRTALARRPLLYVGLVAGLVPLPVLLAAAPGDWSRSAGFSFQRVTIGEYAATQPAVVMHYLRLAVWPQPLVLDYGWPVAGTAADVLPGVAVIGALLAATVWALRRQPAIGFFAAWPFVVVFPSSSVIPIVDLAFEHRMYLALAGIVVLMVLGAYALVRRVPRHAAGLATALFVLVMATLATLTVRRNHDYRSERAIWTDTVAKRPENPRAHLNLGVALERDGELGAATAEFRAALRLRPTYANALSSLGFAMYKQGDPEGAIRYFRAALASEPWNDGAHTNLGVALGDQGKLDEAITHLTAALRTNPASAQAHYNLGVTLAKQGRLTEAAQHERAALEIRPAYPEAHSNLGTILARQGQIDAAMAHFLEAIQLKPDYADAHYNLAVAFVQRGRVPEAREHLQAAIAAKPDFAGAQRALAELSRAR
jgi:tetratricopeptide (TPR) repeat protein